MTKTIIAPARVVARPGAAYSHGTKAGNLIFTGSMAPFNRQGELIGRGDIRAQTRQVLENIKAIIEDGGGTLADVMKVTVYLSNLADFAPMNEAYRTFFPTDPPARSPMVVGLVVEDVLVEMDAYAVLEQP